MTDKAKWAWTTLFLSLLVLLPAVYFYFSDLTETPSEPHPKAPTPEPPSPIAMLIAEDRCDLAYPQLTALDASQHEPTAQAHIEFQRAFCERVLKEPSRAYDRLRDLDLPALDDYRRFWMAHSLEDMGQTHDAIAAYENFLATSANPILRNPASLRLASLYRADDQPAKALALYEEQLAQSTDPAEVLYSLATTSQEHDDSAQAQKWRLELLENHPRSQHALNSLSHLPKKLDARTAYAKAHTYYSHRQFNQAIKSFRHFVRAHSGDQRVAKAHFMLGHAHLSAGHYAKAEQVFRTVHERYGNPAALYRIASLLVRKNREDKAIAAYVDFAKRYPQHDLADDALWQAAKAAERNSLFARAETLYGRLAEHDPQSEYGDEARWSVGFALYCQEQYSEALAAFERASQQARQLHIIDQSLYWAGKSADRLGQTEAATAFYRRAAAGFPRSYYSARAVQLGHREQVQLKERPADSLRQDVPALAHRAHLERAGLLNQLGLRDWSAAEMEQAVSDYKGQKAALKAIRDYYEELGFRDQAMRLSMRLFDGNDPEELSRIYPTYYWEEIAAAAAAAQIDPFLVLSVIRQESTFNEKAVSRAGARGLMQIMPHTGLNLARRLEVKPFELRALFDPAVSIRLGSYFLGDQMRQFTAGAGADLGFELGLAAYNAGPHNARRWLKSFPSEDPDAFVERIPFKETRLYVKLVLKNYAIYKALSDDA